MAREEVEARHLVVITHHGFVIYGGSLRGRKSANCPRTVRCYHSSCSIAGAFLLMICLMVKVHLIGGKRIAVAIGSSSYG